MSRQPVSPRAVAVLTVAMLALAATARPGPVASGGDGTIRGVVDIRRNRVVTEARPASASLGAPSPRPVEPAFVTPGLPPGIEPRKP